LDSESLDSGFRKGLSLKGWGSRVGVLEGFGLDGRGFCGTLFSVPNFLRARFFLTLLLFPIYLFLASCREVPKVPEGYIIFIGDSLTSPYGTVNEEETYPTLLGTAWGREVVNISQPGIRATEAGEWAKKAMSDTAEARGKPSAVFLALGANDQLSGVDAGEAGRKLEEMVRFAQGLGAKVFLVKCIVPLRNRGYASMYKQISRENNTELSGDVIEAYFGVQGGKDADGVHPTARGHEEMASSLNKDFRHFFSR